MLLDEEFPICHLALWQAYSGPVVFHICANSGFKSPPSLSAVILRLPYKVGIPPAVKVTHK